MKSGMRKRVKALMFGAVALGAMHGGTALAACGQTGPINRYVIYANPTDLIVDESLAPGTPLGRDGRGTLTKNFACTGADSILYFSHKLRAGTGDPEGNLYEFLVDHESSGAGVRLRISKNGDPSVPLPVEETLHRPSGSYDREETVEMAFVRTDGPVKYGRVATGTIVFLTFADGGQGGTPTNYGHIDVGPINLVRPSCSMDAGSLNQTVPLGSHSTHELDSNPSPWKAFDLVMQHCTDPNLLTDITFGAAADADTNNSALFSMNQGGPGGLGIAIATNDSSDTRMLPGVIGTFPAVMSGQAFPFRARMERTAGPVRSGTVNRPVTVLVNFR